MARRDLRNPYVFPVCLSVFVVLVVPIAVSLVYEQEFIIAYIAAVNAAMFVLCGYDKMAAKSGQSRVPEVVLWVGALAGGSPALLAAMRLFRHKTSKQSFQAVLVLVVIAQILAAKWLSDRFL